MTRVYPHAQHGKRAFLLVLALGTALAAAGCGGGGGGRGITTAPAPGQPVVGTGFVFRAPSDWTVKVQPRLATASKDAHTLASVAVLPLLKPYRPALFPGASRELDGVAATLASRLHGSVTARRTLVAAGRKSRQYVIVHGNLTDRITFVLRGKSEYLLTCRWRSKDGEPAACGRLAASFRFR